MKRFTCAIVSVAVILAVPSVAHANIWVPSFVRCITAPGPYTLFIIPAIVTIPTLLIISAIEAWVVRRRLKGRQLAGLFVKLFVINGVTGALGLLTMPTGTELWPGLPLCFALTVIAEALLLALMFLPQRPRASIREVFAISLRMNAASYAILASILLAVLWVPSVGKESAGIRDRVKGRLAVVNFPDQVQFLDVSRPARLLDKDNDLGLNGSFGDGRRVVDYVAAPDGSVIALTTEQIVKLRYARAGWSKKIVPLPIKMGEPVGISPDGTLVVFSAEAGPVVYSMKLRRVVSRYGGKADDATFSYDNRFIFMACRHDARISLGETEDTYYRVVIDTKSGKVTHLRDAWAARFGPVSYELAWPTEDRLRIHDCVSGREREIRLPGNTDRGLCWSPDGRYIVYLGQPSFLASDWWHPNVRAVDVRTGKSATIYPHLSTMGRPCALVWLK